MNEWLNVRTGWMDGLASRVVQTARQLASYSEQ